MWHVIENAVAGPVKLGWWMSSANHVCNIHSHDYEGFKQCVHDEPKKMYNDDGEELVVDYLIPGKSKLSMMYKNIIMKRCTVESMSMFLNECCHGSYYRG